MYYNIIKRTNWAVAVYSLTKVDQTEWRLWPDGEGQLQSVCERQLNIGIDVMRAMKVVKREHVKILFWHQYQYEYQSSLDS